MKLMRTHWQASGRQSVYRRTEIQFGHLRKAQKSTPDLASSRSDRLAIGDWFDQKLSMEIHRVCGRPALTSPSQPKTRKRNGLDSCAEMDPAMRVIRPVSIRLDAVQGLLFFFFFNLPLFSSFLFRFRKFECSIGVTDARACLAGARV